MDIDTKINIFTLLVLLGGILGLLFSTLLLMRKQNQQANRFLALFLSAVGLTLIHQFLIDTNYIRHTQILIGSTLPLEFVFPPALFLYIRSMTQETEKKNKWWLHFIPMTIGIILIIPFYILDFDTKLNIIKNNFLDTELSGLFKETFPIFVTATSIQAAIYFYFYLKLLFSHLRNITKHYSSSKNISLSWLRNFLVLLLLLFISAIIIDNLFFQETNLTIHEQWLYILSAAAISYLGFMGLLQPTIDLRKKINSD